MTHQQRIGWECRGIWFIVVALRLLRRSRRRLFRRTILLRGRCRQRIVRASGQRSSVPIFLNRTVLNIECKRQIVPYQRFPLLSTIIDSPSCCCVFRAEVQALGIFCFETSPSTALTIKQNNWGGCYSDFCCNKNFTSNTENHFTKKGKKRLRQQKLSVQNNAQNRKEAAAFTSVCNHSLLISAEGNFVLFLMLFLVYVATPSVDVFIHVWNLCGTCVER